VTLIVFFVWLLANNIGGHEALTFDPVNGWTGVFMFAVAFDLISARDSS
jgi:hypothetical protein